MDLYIELLIFGHYTFSDLEFSFDSTFCTIFSCLPMFLISSFTALKIFKSISNDSIIWIFLIVSIIYFSLGCDHIVWSPCTLFIF